MQFTVHAGKMEHHVGSGIRQVPIFPELLPHLRDCFEQAEPGSEAESSRTQPQAEQAGRAEPALCGPLRDAAACCNSLLSKGIPPRGLEPLSPG